MLRKRLFVSFWLLMVFISGAFYGALAEDVNMTGTWKLAVGTGPNGGTPTFVLQQAGNALTGTYKGRLGEASVKGTVEGNVFKILFGAGGSSNVYKGTVEGNKMSGEATIGSAQTPMSFTGVKE